MDELGVAPWIKTPPDPSSKNKHSAMAKLDPGQPVLVLAAGCGGIKELQETGGILDHPAPQILARFFVCLPWWIYIKKHGKNHHLTGNIGP